MKNVLVIGSTGQIGSELTMKIRNEIPGSTVSPRAFSSKAVPPKSPTCVTHRHLPTSSAVTR